MSRTHHNNKNVLRSNKNDTKSKTSIKNKTTNNGLGPQAKDRIPNGWILRHLVTYTICSFDPGVLQLHLKVMSLSSGWLLAALLRQMGAMLTAQIESVCAHAVVVRCRDQYEFVYQVCRVRLQRRKTP